MNDYDRKYFAKHAMGDDPELNWDDNYLNDYDYGDDDPLISLDDDIVPDFGDEPLEDDYLFEEE